MSKLNITPEEAKHNRVVQEYTELITSQDNYLGLCGNQPTLTKIRQAYQTKEISDTDLALVLNNVAITLKGEPEAFANEKEAFKYMFGDITSKPSPTVLSIAEQAAKIKDIMGEELSKKKKYSGPRKKKAVKPTEAINMAALPIHLQYLAK